MSVSLSMPMSVYLSLCVCVCVRKRKIVWIYICVCLCVFVCVCFCISVGLETGGSVFSELVNDFPLIFAIHQEYLSMIGDAAFNKQAWTQVIPPLVGECCDSAYSQNDKL